MPNDIGSQKGFSGSSMALNGQKGTGADKPKPMGNHNPGNTKPPCPAEKPVPMPK